MQEVVDLQNSMLQSADHSVQMLTESRVAMIPRQAVIDLTLKHPRIGYAMWIDTLVDGSIFREWITNFGAVMPGNGWHTFFASSPCDCEWPGLGRTIRMRCR
jgi:hypothetical protein